MLLLNTDEFEKLQGIHSIQLKYRGEVVYIPHEFGSHLIMTHMFEAKRSVIGKQEKKKRELEKLNQEVEKTEKAIDKFLDLRLADEITRDEYTKKRGELEKLVEQCNQKIEELSRYQDVEDGIEDRIRIMKDILEGNSDYDFSKIPTEVIDAFVEKIVVHEDYFEWHMCYDKNTSLKMSIDGNKKHHEVVWSLNTTIEENCCTGCNRTQEVISLARLGPPRFACAETARK